MTPDQIRAALHEALDSAFAAALDAHLVGHGRMPSLPDRCQTAAQVGRHIESAVRVLLEQDFAARY